MKRILFITIFVCNIVMFTNTKWYIAENEKALECYANRPWRCYNILACYTGVNTKEECEIVKSKIVDELKKINTKESLKLSDYYKNKTKCIEGNYMNVPDCKAQLLDLEYESSSL